MTARTWIQWVAVAVVAVMVVGSLGLMGLAPGAIATHTASSSSTTKSPAVPKAVTTPTISGDPAQAAGERALNAAKAADISPTTVFVPRPSATPSQLAAAASAGYVNPLYHSTPAPIGLAEFGLAQNGSGGVSPFILNTTSVQATFDPSSYYGPNATDLADSSPDGYGVQLNSVVTNVTLFGNDSYQFWTQNVIEYYPYAGEMYLITNVWNFSSPAAYLSSNVFYQHGPYGTQVGNEYYYAFLGPFSDVSYPFNVTFTMTSSIVDGRNAVFFSLVIQNQSGYPVVNATNYDYVIFNSLANDTTPLTQPANYTADGYHYNPLGLTNDFEITIGGPGGGSQTTFLSGNGIETLSYWNNETSSYQAVPSAYSYGGETGETSVGIGVSWATDGSGSPYGILSTGASLLGGLWNASSPSGGPGWLALNVTPSNAFVFVSFAGNSSSPFNITEFEWAATVTTCALILPGGTYLVNVGLADYNPVLVAVTITPGQVTDLNVSLTWNWSLGVYTPLWAWSNSQIAAISTGGNGTYGNPYMIVNNEYGPLPPIFGVLNDYLFPVFPGVYFLGTCAFVDFDQPASFQVDTYSPILPNNNLPFWFYGDSNVAITNATDITGWFSIYAYDYPYFLTFNVEFWNCVDTLIYNDTFNTEAQALLLYNEETDSNPSAGGWSTIWGNHFYEVATASPRLVPYWFGLGLSEQENFDLIYNNYFATPTTAVSFPLDLYYGYYTPYFNYWNICPQNASNVSYAVAWPEFPMSGSIIGTSWQGGNFWWDYGLEFSGFYLVQAAFPWYFFGYNDNPFYQIPYNEDFWIDAFEYGIGDYAPLLYTPLQCVTLATNLPFGTSWEYTVSNSSLPGTYYYSEWTSSPDATILLPYGNYTLNATAPGYYPVNGYFSVSGYTCVPIDFVPMESLVTFDAVGQPNGTRWVVQFNGVIGTTTGSTINFTVLSGAYTFSVAVLAEGWVATPASGELVAQGNTTQWISIAPYAPTFSVYFTASGISPGTDWSLNFSGTNYTTDQPTLIITGVAPGDYTWNVTPPSGYNASQWSGVVDVTSGSVSLGVSFTLITYAVTFVETGLDESMQWAVSLNGVVYGSTSSSITFNVAPGTYDFQVGNITGWNSDPTTGTITVTGNMTVDISFSPTE